MTVRIITADVLAGLAQLPDESVHCVVTSPPYWGLRDYGVQGQLGLEPTLGEHIDAMVAVFREVRRVLRKDGTLWLNYGDCYATSINGRSAADTKAAGNDDRTFRDKPFSTVGPIYDPAGGTKGGGYRGNNRHNSSATPNGRICAGGGLKPKDLCMVPHRVAIALQEDGWWVRADIVWSKPNPMPESITDRPTKSHEYVFLLTKSERYYYDANAVREPFSDGRMGCDYPRPNAPDKIKSPHGQGFTRRAEIEAGARPPSTRPHTGLTVANERRPERERNRGGRTDGFTKPNNIDPSANGGRNRRSVWSIATAPYPEAHFATFPPELPEICIKAGSPKGGTILDPFGGAGTTGLVADRLGRDAILIELNPEYAVMAMRRIKGDAGMFAQVEAPDAA